MPGFFSSNTASQLNEKFNYFLDWSRVGSLITSGHRYSRHELTQRGLIFTSMAVGTYAGYQYAKDKALPGLYSMAGCFVAFVVSHSFVNT